jgi:hypothetical protein
MLLLQAEKKNGSGISLKQKITKKTLNTLLRKWKYARIVLKQKKVLIIKKN